MNTLEVDIKYKQIPIDIKESFKSLTEIGDVVLRNWYEAKNNIETHLGYEFTIYARDISYTGRVSDEFLRDAVDPLVSLVKHTKRAMEAYRKKMLGRVDTHNEIDESIVFSDINNEKCELYMRRGYDIFIGSANGAPIHLDKETARGLIMRLQNWIDRNTFRTKEEQKDYDKYHV